MQGTWLAVFVVGWLPCPTHAHRRDQSHMRADGQRRGRDRCGVGRCPNSRSATFWAP